MLVGVSGIWPTIVGIRVREEEWQKEEDWNMGEESREILNFQTI